MLLQWYQYLPSSPNLKRYIAQTSPQSIPFCAFMMERGALTHNREKVALYTCCIMINRITIFEQRSYWDIENN